jgi:hypothetical protein
MTYALIVIIPLLCNPLDEAIVRYQIDQLLRPRHYRIHLATRVKPVHDEESEMELWQEGRDEPVYELGPER